jgi:glycosyltransferase involved in cell wall biosynthesis
MTSPRLRAWELATQLGERHRVTVAADVPRAQRRDGLRVVPSCRSRVVFEALRHDVVIAPMVPPYLLGALAGSRTLLVADLYNPVELELAPEAHRPEVARFLERARAVKRLQLRFADVILCATERQRQKLARDLERLGREGAGPVVRVVPFGIPPEPTPSPNRPISELLPAVEANDRVVLWWGSVWEWFDAETAIRAFQRAAHGHDDVKLVFAPGKTEVARGEHEARRLAESLGLLNTRVFFLDAWVPYRERHHYLHEAEVGLTLHKDAAEAEFAARYRYMDYLWAALPCVLGAGDELGDQFAEAGFARIVPRGNLEAAGDALADLLADPHARQGARASGQRLADSFRWSTVVAPLIDALDELGTRPAGTKSGAMSELTGYYAWRLRRTLKVKGAPH